MGQGPEGNPGTDNAVADHNICDFKETLGDWRVMVFFRSPNQRILFLNLYVFSF